MRTRLATVLGISLLALLGALSLSPRVGAQRNAPSGALEKPATDVRAARLETGRKLFLERCAKCHDARGDKALPSGPPLNERKLTPGQIARAVNGRFRDRTAEERRAAALYVESLLKR